MNTLFLGTVFLFIYDPYQQVHRDFFQWPAAHSCDFLSLVQSPSVQFVSQSAYLEECCKSKAILPFNHKQSHYEILPLNSGGYLVVDPEMVIQEENLFEDLVDLINQVGT